MNVFGHLFHSFKLLVTYLPFPWADDPSPQCPMLHISLPPCGRILLGFFLMFCLLDVILEYGSYLADHGLSHPNSCQNIAEVEVCQVRNWQRKRGPSNRKPALTKCLPLSPKSSATITSHLNSQNLLPNFVLQSELMLCKQTDLQIRFHGIVRPAFAGRVSALLVIQTFFSAGVVLTVHQSAAAPRGVSSVTCLTSTALTPQWAEAHNIFMMPTQALSG